MIGRNMMKDIDISIKSGSASRSLWASIAIVAPIWKTRRRRVFTSCLHTQRTSLIKGHRGMTAIELLATLSIVAILSAMAVPAFRDFVQNNRAAEQSNALVGALALARNEAVTRGVPVSVCVSSDSESCDAAGGLFTFWTPGWIVFTDARIGRTVGYRLTAGHACCARCRLSPVRLDARQQQATLFPTRPAAFSAVPRCRFLIWLIPDCTGNQNRRSRQSAGAGHRDPRRLRCEHERGSYREDLQCISGTSRDSP